MKNIVDLKLTLCAVLGALGGVIAEMFGGWTGDMTTLVIFMALDFATGLAVAGIFKKSGKSESGALESHAGWKGLCKKGATLLIVLVAHRLDLIIGSDYIKTATIIGFITNELISIIENVGLMGIKFPTAITKAVEVLKNKSDSENGGGEK